MAATDTIARAINDLCTATAGGDTAQSLLARINAAVQRPYRLVYSRANPNRVGGLVDPDGDRVTDDLAAWLREHYDGDAEDFATKYSNAGYLVTKFSSWTHFLTARDRDGPLDFIQLTVEEEEESVDRALFDPDHLPTSLEAVIAPETRPRSLGVPVKPSSFKCVQVDRFTDRADKLTSATGDPAFHRFMADWAASSAGETVPFRNHWAIELVPAEDAGKDAQRVKLLSPHARTVQAADWTLDTTTLAGIDKACGFTMAWYFLMVAEKYITGNELKSAARGLILAENDLAVFDGWLADPYWL